MPNLVLFHTLLFSIFREHFFTLFIENIDLLIYIYIYIYYVRVKQIILLLSFVSTLSKLHKTNESVEETRFERTSGMKNSCD